jgi:hypothetical protein
MSEMRLRPHPDWRQALVESYADLFHPVGASLATPGIPAVGDGWRDLLERACARIRTAIRDNDTSFRVTQISEKYGTLRFQWEGSPSPAVASRVEEAVDLAEARSATTCETCGEHGVLRAGNWLTTRCDVHAEERSPVEVEEGLGIHQVERRSIDGRWRTSIRFYDRVGDRFVEAGRLRRMAE